MYLLDYQDELMEILIKFIDKQSLQLVDGIDLNEFKHLIVIDDTLDEYNPGDSSTR